MPGPRINPQRILDLILDTVFVVDAHGRFVEVSASCGRMLGYTPEELRGTYMIENVHPDDRSRTLQVAWKVIAGKPSVLFENRWLHKDRRIVHLQWTAAWAEPEHLRVAVARDITALRQAEAAAALETQASQAPRVPDPPSG
jgi:PAS domain S-box-containing protein